jgi:hypothetical protein
MDLLEVDLLVDGALAIGVLLISGVLICAFTLLRREITKGMTTLLELLRSQREMERRIERMWERIDEIEKRERQRS